MTLCRDAAEVARACTRLACRGFLICSIAIGGAIFLILEMDQPMGGEMQISSCPMRNALAQMNW